ncbi:MAG TPA: DDE-type integrase/transposase/recombinase [Pyrinomonadaceae bacterium]|nr:DDE-type integrase/transposase/recombinase [Pyrinomonadaceae bacterium]
MAYTAAFDRRALAATCSRYRQVSAERGLRCAMEWIKGAMGTRKSVTLGEACERYAPEINKRIRPHLKLSGDSYRGHKTYVKVGKSWKYLYRAVDKEGQTIEFMLSAKCDGSAAKRFFKKEGGGRCNVSAPSTRRRERWKVSRR